MKLTYIYHSCYVLETDGFAVIFDYYKDTGKSPVEGYVHDELLKKKKRLYVLASHAHPDHFNPDVLKWKKINKDIVYILSSDILHQGKAKMKDALYLKKGDEYEDKNIYVKAFGSTDVGVSFLLRIAEKQIFHAGDLNNWHWMDYSTDAEVEEAEKAYVYELGLLAKETPALDLAMFPVDPRQGRGYMRGAEQFVSAIRTTLFAPMHFAEAYDKVEAFRAYAEAQHCIFLALISKGQTFEL